VGRFFMEHMHCWSGLWIPSGTDLLDGISAYTDIRTVDGAPALLKLALSEAIQRREGLLNQNVQLIPRTVSRTALFPRVNSSKPRARAVSWYRRVRRGVERRLDRPRLELLRLANMSEQVPNPESRVLLAEERDALGMRKVRLNWCLTSQDTESIRRTQEILGGAFRTLGLGRVMVHLLDDTPPEDLHGGYHHMGTTRMHDSPRSGVVDRDGLVHGVSNLYVAGPSVFPTGGYANPVLTIIALSIRLAEHLKRQAAPSAVPIQADSATHASQ
jgi:choline dehydrogenase-like flavoprotein